MVVKFETMSSFLVDFGTTRRFVGIEQCVLLEAGDGQLRVIGRGREAPPSVDILIHRKVHQV